MIFILKRDPGRWDRVWEWMELVRAAVSRCLCHYRFDRRSSPVARRAALCWHVVALARWPLARLRGGDSRTERPWSQGAGRRHSKNDQPAPEVLAQTGHLWLQNSWEYHKVLYFDPRLSRPTDYCNYMTRRPACWNIDSCEPVIASDAGVATESAVAFLEYAFSRWFQGSVKAGFVDEGEYIICVGRGRPGAPWSIRGVDRWVAGRHQGFHGVPATGSHAPCRQHTHAMALGACDYV